MQYFSPEPPYFVGDCMPFFHEGTFHLIYLLDENHHQALGGLGGHQWAHASTRNLIDWRHHPLALPCDQDWEGSICTGTVFVHDGQFRAFYATRQRSDRHERLSLAISTDGITYQKTKPNPFAAPGPGYKSRNYRDPFVFQDAEDGRFHMLVTAALDDFPLHDRGGCLAHLTSDDLQNWTVEAPFLVPGSDPGYSSVPECPDYFEWNGWYYLIFSLNGEALYRMSRKPYGPWLRPPHDTFDGPTLACVMKTAPFTGNRRIGVPYLASRKDDKDSGERIYAGNALFRELVQRDDGTLGTKFPPEMTPGHDRPPIDWSASALTKGADITPGLIRIDAPQSLESAVLHDLPRNARVTMTITPKPGTAEYGLGLRGRGAMEEAYYLRLRPNDHRVQLNRQSIAMDRLDQPTTIEVVMSGDIIDVCIQGRRCIVDRAYDLGGSDLFIFAQWGEIEISGFQVQALL